MSDRIAAIDNAKGIAIFLVVLGHVVPAGLLRCSLYSFHMPLFFVLSGLFLMKNPHISLYKYVKNKFFRLYVPYVLYGLFVLVPFDYIWCHFVIPIPELQELVVNKVLGTIPAFRSDWTFYGQLWFLPCLLIGSIIIKFVYTYANKFKYILIFILYIIGIIFNHYIHRSLPFSIDASLLSLPFLLFGILITENQWKFSNWFCIISSFILLSFAIYFNHVSPDMYIGVYGNYLLFIISGISGSIFVISICGKLPRITFLQLAGKNTLNIYALHFCLFPFTNYGLRYFTDSLLDEVLVSLYSIIVSIIAILVLIPICNFINKFLPILAGVKIRRQELQC